MANYAPKYLYADQATATASAAITGGQTLVVSGDGTLGPAGTSGICVGVAAQDAATGARFSYFPRGKVHISTALGAVAFNVLVNTAAGGTVDDGGTNPVGVSLTSAGAGELIEWMEF